MNDACDCHPVLTEGGLAHHEDCAANKPDPLACKSGRHRWLDPEDRRRCCHGFVRVQDTTHAGLERIGAENIKLAGMWRGWVKAPTRGQS